MCITHPAHPLRGQAIAVIPHQKQKNPDLIEIQLADGERRFIPVGWTDQVPPVVTLPGARFLLANLLSLRQQVDELLQVIEESSILPQEDTQIEGGSSELHKPVHLVEIDRHSACPGHSHSGTDSSTPTKPRRGA